MHNTYAVSGLTCDHCARAVTEEVRGTPTVLSYDFAIDGMTCASCANRIEKKLNKLEGVTASVNYATEKAHVEAPIGTSADDLIATVARTGYSAHVERRAAPVAARPDHAAVPAAADAESDSLRQRLLISTALAAPVLVISMIPALQFDNWQWLCLMLAAPVAMWGAWPFHRAAVIDARHGAATMDTLIAIGVLAAFGWSLWALFLGDAGVTGMTMSMQWFTQGSGAHEIYLEVASAVTVFLLLGRYLETRAKRESGAALRALLELGAKDVTVVRHGEQVTVPLDQLAVGEHFVIRPGEKVATDAVVVEGSSAVDQSMLTGESVPVEVTRGSTLIGGTVNAGGRLIARVTQVGERTQLASMARLVEQAQSGKADVQRMADRVSAVFVPVVLVVAVVTSIGWLLLGFDATSAFTAAVAVLIIACPCALGLATPTALLAGTGRGAQVGILVKGPAVLESTRRVDTIVLDKTGTVTRGEMGVAGVHPSPGTEPVQLLAYAGALESASEHPIGAAITHASATQATDAGVVSGVQATAGLGISGHVGDELVVAGRASWLSDGWGLDVPESVREAAAADDAATPVWVAWGRDAGDLRVRGAINVADTVKETSAQAVEELRALGLEPILLTGDHQGAAQSVARAVGIERVIAEVLPADKVSVIEHLQGEGRVVAMVGDGVNDAAALATADLGIAMGTGTDVAIEASDLTIVRGDLRLVGDAIRLSRSTLRTIKANLAWAFGYNAAAIPLAAFGFLNPLIAGAAMSASSVLVVTNSLRLRHFQSR